VDDDELEIAGSHQTSYLTRVLASWQITPLDYSFGCSVGPPKRF
jgi:hypothetical protein